MAKKEEIKLRPRAKFPSPLPRRMLVSALVDAYSRDVEEVLINFPKEHRVELLEHMIFGMDILIEYVKTPEKSIWKKYADQEEAFLKKHKNRLQQYRNKQFARYYWPESAIMETDIMPAEEFNKLRGDDQVLTEKEMESFFRHARNFLSMERDMTLLNEEPEATSSSGETISTELNGKDPGVTLSAQLLVVYYLLKQLGIEPRGSADISAVARFTHFLLGKKMGTLSNSDIYKRLRKMPNIKGDKELVKELQAIRPYFAELGLKDILFEIDKEIGLARKAKLKKGRGNES